MASEAVEEEAEVLGDKMKNSILSIQIIKNMEKVVK